MPIRTEFYVTKSEPESIEMEWLGAVHHDELPSEVPFTVLAALSEDAYRRDVAAFIASEGGVEAEWSSPWEECGLNYVYQYVGDDVVASVELMPVAVSDGEVMVRLFPGENVVKLLWRPRTKGPWHPLLELTVPVQGAG